MNISKFTGSRGKTKYPVDISTPIELNEGIKCLIIITIEVAFLSGTVDSTYGAICVHLFTKKSNVTWNFAFQVDAKTTQMYSGNHKILRGKFKRKAVSWHKSVFLQNIWRKYKFRILQKFGSVFLFFSLGRVIAQTGNFKIFWVLVLFFTICYLWPELSNGNFIVTRDVVKQFSKHILDNLS